MAYVIPPMVTAVVVKLTTPLPELLAVKSPVKVAEKESLPALGMVWVIVRVKVPEALMVPEPDAKVWKLPKLEPVGVFRLVDPRPVNVIMRALPVPPRKVTELVPLPEQPAHVKVPDVENVTASALASDVPSVTIAKSNALIRVALKRLVIFAPFDLGPQLYIRTLPSTRKRLIGLWHSVYGSMFYGDTCPVAVKNIFFELTTGNGLPK